MNVVYIMSHILQHIFPAIMLIYFNLDYMSAFQPIRLTTYYAIRGAPAQWRQLYVTNYYY